MRGKKWLLVIRTLAGTMVALSIIVGLFMMPDPHLILRQAHKRGWWETPDTTSTPDPHPWYDDHTFWRLKAMPGTNYESLFLQDAESEHVTPVEPFNSTLATLLQQSKLPPVPAPFRARRPPANFNVTNQGFSPDHRWLLWQSTSTPGDYIALSLQAQTGQPIDKSTDRSKDTSVSGSADRKQIVKWTNTSINRYRRYASWLPDSRHWITLTWGGSFDIGGVVLRDLMHPDEIITKKFAKPAGKWPSIVASGNHLITYEPYWTDPRKPVSNQTLTYYDIPLDEPVPAPQEVDVPLKSGTTCMGMYPSPDHRQMLLTLYVEKHLPGSARMQTLYARMGLGPKVQEQLWLCNIDGSDLHELGHLPERGLNRPIGGRKEYTTHFYSIEWLPGSRSIQFGCGDAYYTLDI